ncbi:MAG: hypothetical protein AVDCRST_MAG85-2348 [uncultured Solirubrobacteraceae bacterium]|uniref:protein-glutamate methylesterase n=1 Tax=uncultured Solirubrobacteraceae bacterium TaxID=1162706 RepID=A0A6J4T1E1_9ACTN|nr:MAG: hypothetical protein AVDCRST_MAG85-2348 [uncultured Solirubrobacteraceae bacterium]
MDARTDEQHLIVAIVASVGGLEAVTSVLGALPRSFDASLIVLIHQQPDRVGHLVELLGRDCALPVLAAEHGARLRPGVVTVVPSGTHLLVTAGGGVALIESGKAPPSRPSADLLLSTLATAVGERAVALVLSGGGHDGATGATAVHVCGGTVLASDEATSTVFSMPSATITRDHTVDQVVPLHEAAEALVALVKDR